MNNFLCIEIEVMNDGTIAKAISEPVSKGSALSQLHQIMASAIINENVKSVFTEVRDTAGNPIKTDYWEVEEPAPEEE